MAGSHVKMRKGGKTMVDNIYDVLDGVRPSFEYQVQFVKRYLGGKGLDMGCGSCPLLDVDAYYIDISPQPLCEVQVPDGTFIQTDAVRYQHNTTVDFIFSSHMIEDLGSQQAIVECMNRWAEMLNVGGYLVLILPDMQGGRYATVEEGGNPSHQVNVGRDFIVGILDFLPNLALVQLDSIPHDRSCSIDAVFRRT